MNHIFNNIFIAVFSAIYLILLSVLILDIFFYNTLKDIFSITSSFFTTIIAILLYDRFSYRKIISEKKLDVVLKLLEHIKTLHIQVNYVNTKKNKYYAGWLQINSRKVEHFINNLNPNANIVFSTEELHSYLKEINMYRTNPFLPKEIVKNLDFLSISYLESVENNIVYKDEYVKITINKDLKELGLNGCCKARQDISFFDFTNNYLICLSSIEKWIDKHSNVRSYLNI